MVDPKVLAPTVFLTLFCHSFSGRVPLPFSVVEGFAILVGVLLVGTIVASFAFLLLRKYRAEGGGRRVHSNKTIKSVMMSEYNRRG